MLRGGKMNFMDQSLYDLKVGLVLAGGGTKGAYQAGVMQALWDLDLINNITAVSGVSIGTLNSLMLCMKKRDLIDISWKSLTYQKIVTKSEGFKLADIGEIIKLIATGHKPDEIAENVDLSALGLISQKGIRDYIEEFVDMPTLKSTNIDIYSCAYNINDGHPEYFKLNDYNEEEIIDISIASCAVPFIFTPVTFKGKQYADGGINNPLYSGASADNVPIAPIMNHDLDLIIIVHLTYTDKVDLNLYPQANIIEIYPSFPLEIVNGSGTLNFNQTSIKERIEIGYRDGVVTLAPMLIAYLKGKNIAPYIKHHVNWNNQFLKKYRK